MSTEETKAEKFIRLRDLRLAKVLDGLRILSNITNPRDYDYTPEQAQEVIDQLQERVDALAADFGLPPRSTTAEASHSDSDPDASDDQPEEIEAEAAPSAPVDPKAPKSRITELDGKKLKVEPGAWTNMDLYHAGPRLGLAMEAVMDGDKKTALEHLKQVLSA